MPCQPPLCHLVGSLLHALRSPAHSLVCFLISRIRSAEEEFWVKKCWECPPNGEESPLGDDNLLVVPYSWMWTLNGELGDEEMLRVRGGDGVRCTGVCHAHAACSTRAFGERGRMPKRRRLNQWDPNVKTKLADRSIPSEHQC